MPTNECLYTAILTCPSYVGNASAAYQLQTCGLYCTEDKWPRVNLGAALHLEEPRWPSLRNETAPVSRREKPNRRELDRLQHVEILQDQMGKKKSSGEDIKAMIAVLSAHDRHREVARKTDIFPPHGTRKCRCFSGRGAEAGRLQGATVPVKLPPVAKTRHDWTPATASQGLLP